MTGEWFFLPEIWRCVLTGWDCSRNAGTGLLCSYCGSVQCEKLNTSIRFANSENVYACIHKQIYSAICIIQLKYFPSTTYWTKTKFWLVVSTNLIKCYSYFIKNIMPARRFRVIMFKWRALYTCSFQSIHNFKSSADVPLCFKKWQLTIYSHC